MSLESIIGLFLATVILGLSPGPAMFATMGHSISQGLKPAFLFIIGITLGDLCFSLVAMLGLAALASQYGFVFTLIKVIGGLYLIYLGLRACAVQAKLISNYPIKKAV